MEEGKTVKATLKVVIDTTDAKKQADDFDAYINKAGSGGGGGGGGSRGGNRSKLGDLPWTMRSRMMRDMRSVNRLELNKDKAIQRENERVEREIIRAKRQNLKNMVQGHNKKEREVQKESEWVERETVRAKRQNLRNMVKSSQAKERDEKRETVRAELMQKRQDRAQERALLQTANMMHLGGVVGRMGQIQTYGRTLTDAGYGGIGGKISRNYGKLTSAATVAHEGMTSWNAVSRANANPYATTSQRQSLYLKNRAPQMWDFYTLHSGRQQAMSEADVHESHMGVRYQNATEQHRTQMDWRRTSDNYQGRARAFERYGPAGMGTLRNTDRGASSIEDQKYRERLRMQPLLQQQQKADMELAAARNNSMLATRRAADAEKEYIAASTKATHLQNQANAIPENSAENVGLKKRNQDEAGLAHEAAAARKTVMMDAIRDQQQANANIAHASQSSRAAVVQRKQGELENLRDREQLAANGAHSIGGMGEGARNRGKLAFEMIRQHGIRYASPEQIAAAESVAPNEMKKIKEQEGARLIESDPFYKGTKDIQYQDNLKDVRRQVDEKHTDVVESDVRNEKETARELADAFAPRFAETLLDAIQKEVSRQIAAKDLQGQRGVMDQLYRPK